MEAVEFLDSTGLGVLVGGLKKVRAHDGSLQLICNQDRLLKIFRITGLAKVFTIHESADAALPPDRPRDRGPGHTRCRQPGSPVRRLRLASARLDVVHARADPSDAQGAVRAP